MPDEVNAWLAKSDEDIDLLRDKLIDKRGKSVDMPLGPSEGHAATVTVFPTELLQLREKKPRKPRDS